MVRLALLLAALPFLIFFLTLVGCQSRLIYFPRPYGAGTVAAFRKEAGTKVIDYQTSDGPQQAYLYSPSAKPERLWIVCGGNGTVALDWADWIRDHAPRQDAWLLFDMPGYGASTGKPAPWSIRRSLKAVIPAAEQALGWQPGEAQSQGKLRFFGHSLGAGVVMMAAEEYDIRKGVLLAPFTSTMDMAQVTLHLPLGWAVWHRFNNEARLAKIAKQGGGEVTILHGADDEVIPAAMSRKMAAEFPGLIQYQEIPGGRHNTLSEMVPDKIAAALERERK